ncbi:MAG: fibronectin type III domain-containing protein [Acutalibacteraceae bacterium]
MKKTTRIFALVAAAVLLFASLSVSTFAVTAPSAPEKLTASASCVSVVLKWSKTSATGYRVYKLENNKYKKLATTKQNTYTVKDLEAATSYVFAVRAYNKQGDKTVWSEKYVTVKVKTKAPSTVTVKASAGNGKAVLSWTASQGAQGYAVYRYVSKQWKKIASVKSSVRKYTVTDLKNGSTYKFAVKPYTKVNGKTVWGSLSKSVSVKPEKTSVQSICDKYNKAVNDLKAYKKTVRIKYVDSSTAKYTDCSDKDMLSMMNSMMESLYDTEPYVSYFTNGKNADGYKLSEIIWPEVSTKVNLKAAGVKSADISEKDGGYVINITLVSEKYYYDSSSGKKIIPTYNNAALGGFDVEFEDSPASIDKFNFKYPATVLSAVTDSKGRLIKLSVKSPYSGSYTMSVPLEYETSTMTAALKGTDSRTVSVKYY